MRPLASTGVAVALVLAAAGCDGSQEKVSRAAQVYASAIRAVVQERPPDADPETLPVVYVVSSGEEKIAAEVQADVSRALNGDADVRFADAREEAILEEEPGEPVRDGGSLLAVAPIDVDAPDEAPVDLEIEVYRSTDDWSRRVVTFERANTAWSVSSTSLLAVDDGPGSTEPGG